MQYAHKPTVNLIFFYTKIFVVQENGEKQNTQQKIVWHGQMKCQVTKTTFMCDIHFYV